MERQRSLFKKVSKVSILSVQNRSENAFVRVDEVLIPLY